MAVTDNFNRANGGLGANWTTDSSFTALAIVSNACKGGTAGVHNVSYYNASGTLPADQHAQITVTATGSYVGPVLRSNGAGTFYTCYHPPASGGVAIYKWVAGAATPLSTGGTSITPTVGDVVYFEVVGSALTVKVNGVVINTATDSAITGAGYTGIDIFDTPGAVDDFEIGPLAVTVTVNLTGVSASPAIGVLGFNGSLPLVGVSATPVIGTGTVTLIGTVTVNLTGVAAAPTIGTGTVAIEGAVIEPPPVSPGGGTGAGRTGMRLRPTEDKAVYLKGVAANPKIGQVMVLHEMQRVYEKYTTPIPKVQTPAEMPPGMRGLFKPVEKPIPPAVFVYPAPFPKLRSAVGNGKVNAFYEDIDEETIMLIDLL